MRSRYRGSRLVRNMFRPRLETLEQAQVPACTLSVVASTLFIHGDNTDNDIDIVKGTETTVACDGAPAVHFTGIDRLKIDTGQGDDQVHILIGLLPTHFRIEAGLGRRQRSVPSRRRRRADVAAESTCPRRA